MKKTDNIALALRDGPHILFPTFFIPREVVAGGGEKFSCLIVLDKETNKQSLADLKDAIKTLTANAFGGEEVNHGIKPAEEKYPDIEELAGKLLLNAYRHASFGKPPVYSINGKDKLTGDDHGNHDAIYSGFQGNLNLSAYPYAVGANKGVGFGLDGVQWIGTGWTELQLGSSEGESFDAVDGEDPVETGFDMDQDSEADNFDW